MSIKELFETQKELRSVIYDRFPKLKNQNNLDWLKLALQVELGELANEQRTWKEWSDDKEPRTEFLCSLCEGSGEISSETAVGTPDMGYDLISVDVNCPLCEEVDKESNPLLEEYADSLSFIIEIGLEIETEQNMAVESFNYYPVNMHKHLTIPETFTSFISDAGKLGESEGEEDSVSYVMYFCHFLGFGETLGFTVDEIIEAYYKKNKINHRRQEVGY